MSMLANIADVNWTVVCENRSNRFVWLYVFSPNGTVRWKDEGNGMTGNGTWQIKDTKLITRWYNSATVETWNAPPIDPRNWTGTCTMKGFQYSLKAVARNFFEVDLGTDYHRTPESKAAFLDSCVRAKGKLQTATLLFSAWLSGISIAYGQAFEAHNRVLNDISATERLATELLLGFATAFLGGGVGGSVGAAMKAASAGDFMVDGVKDLAKFSVRGPSAAIFRAKQVTGMPASPLQWQNSINQRVSSEMALISAQIDEWHEAVASDDTSFNANFDPTKETEEDLTIHHDGIVVRLLSPPPLEESLQTKFEQGWLVAWIRTYGRSVTQIPVARESVYGKLSDYGRRLGDGNIEALLNDYIPLPKYDPPPHEP